MMKSSLPFSANRVLVEGLFHAACPIRVQAKWSASAQEAVMLADQLERLPAGRKYREACLPTLSKTLRAAPKDCRKSAKGAFVVDFVPFVNASGVVDDFVVEAGSISPCIAKAFKRLALPKLPFGNYPIRIHAELTS